MDSRPVIATSYAPHDGTIAAIRREKALKRWSRVGKLELIRKRNPEWADLYPALCGTAPDPRVRPEDDGEDEVARFLKYLPREN